MTVVKPTGQKYLISYSGRCFHPNDYFIFSGSKPSSTLCRIPAANWRLVQGTFRPDQIIDPSTMLTFIAIAQCNSGAKCGSLVATHEEKDLLQVFTIVLVATGNAAGDYIRVRYAVWEDCAWYGFMCGQKAKPGRDIERAEGWRSMFTWGNLEQMGWSREVEGAESHEHRYQVDHLPNLGVYHENTGVEEKSTEDYLAELCRIEMR